MNSKLPDISTKHSTLPHAYSLDWVGIENIALPLNILRCFIIQNVDMVPMISVLH